MGAAMKVASTKIAACETRYPVLAIDYGRHDGG